MSNTIAKIRAGGIEGEEGWGGFLSLETEINQ